MQNGEGVEKQEPPDRKIRGSAGRACVDYLSGGFAPRGAPLSVLDAICILGPNPDYCKRDGVARKLAGFTVITEGIAR